MIRDLSSPESEKYQYHPKNVNKRRAVVGRRALLKTPRPMPKPTFIGITALGVLFGNG